MSEEIEIKLEVTPAAMHDIARAAPLVARGVKFSRAQTLTSIYYDNPKQSMRRDGVFLRLRQNGKICTQTVKTTGDGGLLARRGEWEWKIKGPEPDLALALTTELKPLEKRLRKGDLAPIFVNEMARRTAHLTIADSVMELALDEGQLSAGRRREAICEMEIELKAGSAGPLFDLVRELVAIPGVTVSAATKAGRGFALASGKKPGPVRAIEAELTTAMTAEQAAAAILAGCAAQAAGNIPAIVRHKLSDGVHQLRVSLRRLRAALAVFKDVLEPGMRKGLSKEAAWLAGAMGDARDLDVMIGSTIRSAAGPDHLADDIKGLTRSLTQARRVAWRAAMDAAASSRASLLLVNTSDAAWSLRHAPPPMDGVPLRVFAVMQLERRFEAVLKAAGEDLQALTIEGRHDVRLALKKLRYTADFFTALFPKKTARKGLKVLARLQEALGGFNDAAVVETILHRTVEAASSKNKGSLDRAVLFVSGWSAHRGARAWDDAVACWRDFASDGAFWR